MPRPKSSPFPRLTRQERTALNQVLWAKRILREAPAERLQLASQIEELDIASGRLGARPVRDTPDPPPTTPIIADLVWAGLGLPPRSEKAEAQVKRDRKAGGR